MIQRIRDYLHERAIARQGKILADICDHGTNADARREYAKLSKLVLARSPQQVKRMEDAIFRKLDPHAQQTFLNAGGSIPRASIKRAVMGLFFRRLIPTRAVTFLFRLLGLKGA